MKSIIKKYKDSFTNKIINPKRYHFDLLYIDIDFNDIFDHY